MKPKIVLYVLGLLISIYFFGCTAKTYDGPSLSKDERVILKIGKNFPRDWNIVAINGRRAWPKYALMCDHPLHNLMQFELKPGLNGIFLSMFPFYDIMIYSRSGVNDYEIWHLLYAKPGQIYTIDEQDKYNDTFSIYEGGRLMDKSEYMFPRISPASEALIPADK